MSGKPDGPSRAKRNAWKWGPRKSRSLYEVLGVESSATSVEIRRAYRQRALLAHPDKGGSFELFLEVSQAFETLGSVCLRANYDRRLKKMAESELQQRSAKRGPFELHADTPSKRQHVASPCKGEASSPSKSAPGQDVHQTDSLHKHAIWLSRVLDRLRLAVAALPSDCRRQTLETFSSRVRSALLVHMSSKSKDRMSDPANNPEMEFQNDCVMLDWEVSICSDSESQVDSDEVMSSASSVAADDISCEQLLAIEYEGEHNTSADCKACMSGPAKSDCKMQPTMADVETVRACPSLRNRTGCQGVFKVRGTKNSYRAAIHFSFIRLFTRFVKTLEEAIDFYTILTAAKNSVMTSASATSDLRSHLFKALEQSCEEAGIELPDLGLLAGVMMRAPAFVGKTLISGRITKDVDGAIRWRNKLTDAKKESWAAFRAVWIDLLQEPQLVGAWGRSRQQRKTLEEATAIVDSVWERHHAERERRAQKQQARDDAKQRHALERAVSAASVVEKALKSKDKKDKDRARSEVEESRRKWQAQREARWKWWRDPARTMDEILRGSPQQ